MVRCQMKLCKYCNSVMMSEYETKSHNSYRRKGFHTCPKCKAVCDDDITQKKNDVIVHSERWFNPTTKEFE